MSITPRRKLVVTVVTVLAFVAAVVPLTYLVDHLRGQASGRSMGATLEAGPTGDVLVLVDWLREEDGARQRTTSIDLASGRRVAQRFADTMITWPAAPGPCGGPREVDVAGTVLRLPPYPGELGAPAYAETPAGTVTIADTVMPLRFVGDARRGGAAIVDDGGVLLVHLVGFDGARGGDRWLSKIDRHGRPVWRVSMGACELATVEGDTVVLATSQASRRAMAVELATGRVRWTFGF